MTVRRVLVLGGLVLATGPLSFAALAQGDFVDLEAEAAAKAATRTPVDPYGVEPARSYPAASYGVSGTPAPSSTVIAPSHQAPASGSANVGNLVLQVQQLQQEVLRLNGRLEEQAHEIRTLKDQNLQRYMDLDKRLSELSAGGVAVSPPVAAKPPAQSSQPERQPIAVTPGEKAAYDAAYALVTGKRFAEARAAFQKFLRNYPDGKYAPNAHYWLGELYLVQDPPDLESARQSFALLISEYPAHTKVPDALFKLGKVQFEKGNREKAREYLDLVIANYSATNKSVVKLARDFIAANY